MSLKSKGLEAAFAPNIPTTNIKDLYVDTGDFGRLMDILSSPQTFLVYGERGAGKSLLFNVLKTELAANLARYYKNLDFIRTIGDIRIYRGKDIRRPRIPVFLRITRNRGSPKELLFDTVHEIIRNTVKALLLSRAISNGKLFRDEEADLASLLARLEETEITGMNGEKIGFRVDLGGKVIPVGLSAESSNEFSRAQSAKPIKELRTLHALGEDLLGLIRSEGVELVIVLDEFDKISPSETAEILRSEQGPLFEALRSNFSFLIPASSKHVEELEKPEYLGIFTSRPFNLTPFDLKHAKEMVDKRLLFHKELIGSRIGWKDVFGEGRFRGICEISNHVPRVIMSNLQKEVSNRRAFPIE